MSNSLYPSQVRGLGYTVIKAPEDAVVTQQSPAWYQTRIVQSQNPIWHWTLLYDFLADNAPPCGDTNPYHALGPMGPNANYFYSDFQTLLGFVTARRNSYDDFLFMDPDDNFFGPGIITQGWLPAFSFALGAIIIVGGNAWQVTSTSAGAKSANYQPAFSTSPQVDGGLTWTQLGAALGGGTLWPNPAAQLQVISGTSIGLGTAAFFTPIQINRGGQFYEDVFDIAGPLTIYENGSVSNSANYVLHFGGLSLPGISTAGLYLEWVSGYTPTQPVTAKFNYYYRVHFEDDSAADFEKWANQWWTVGGDNGTKGKGTLKMGSSRVPVSASNGLPGLAPMPPINFPPCSGRFVILYPTQVTLSYGSGPGQTTGFAAGLADGTANSWFEADLHFQGLGSAPGSAAFFGFSLPSWLPPASVLNVYSVTAYNHNYKGGFYFGSPGGLTGCNCTISFIGGVGPTGTLWSNGLYGSFINVNAIDTSGGSGFPAANAYPFKNVVLTYNEGALDFTTSSDTFLGRPCLIVFY